MEKILGREGEDKTTTQRFYVAVVQAVIMFGSETWVLNPRLEKAHAGFHHQGYVCSTEGHQSGTTKLRDVSAQDGEEVK